MKSFFLRFKMSKELETCLVTTTHFPEVRWSWRWGNPRVLRVRGTQFLPVPEAGSVRQEDPGSVPPCPSPGDFLHQLWDQLPGEGFHAEPCEMGERGNRSLVCLMVYFGFLSF